MSRRYAHTLWSPTVTADSYACRRASASRSPWLRRGGCSKTASVSRTRSATIVSSVRGCPHCPSPLAGRCRNAMPPCPCYLSATSSLDVIFACASQCEASVRYSGSLLSAGCRHDGLPAVSRLLVLYRRLSHRAFPLIRVTPALYAELDRICVHAPVSVWCRVGSGGGENCNLLGSV